MAGWYPGKNIGEAAKGLGHKFMEGRRARQGVRERGQAPLGDAPQIQGAQERFGADRGAQEGALASFAQPGPSQAEIQLRGAQQQNVVDQMSMAAGQRGGNLAGQARQIAGMGAAAGMGTAQDAAQLRAEEDAANRAAYAQQANMMAGMSGGQMGQNLAMSGQYGIQGQQLAQQQLQNQQQFGLGVVDRGVGVAGMAGKMGATFSDERLKTDIEDGEDEAGDAMAAMSPVSYRYKSERHGDTKRKTTGVKAQDMLRSKAGSKAVRSTPEGLAFDHSDALSLVLAHGSSVEKRLRKVEGPRNARG